MFQMGGMRAALADFMHHKVLGQSVMPVSALLEMALASGKVSLSLEPLQHRRHNTNAVSWTPS